MEKMIKEAQKYLGEEYFSNLSISYAQDEDKTLLKVVRHDKDVVIIYGEPVMMFRGLTLVKEKHLENDYEIELHRHFEHNCWMIDVSRNATFKVEQVKNVIMIMALFGMDQLMLYTEDTYEIKKYPYFGYLRGRYTKEDLQEMVEYGKSLGVELVSCIETLDHLGRTLRWDAFGEIVDGPTNVLVEEEKSYVLIEEMIKACRESFTSKTIHLGMDECWGLGLGRYKNLHGLPKDRVKLFNDHLKRVIEICHKYDFQPMIWGDMYFRLVNVDGNYYSDKDLTPEIKAMIPTDVDLVYWDYYHDFKKVYDEMTEKYQRLPNKTIFAGGAWNWASFSPFIKLALSRSKLALESMIEHGIKDVMVTTWGDSGAECSNYTALPSLAVFSIYDYFGKYNEEALKSMLLAVTGEKLENMFLLDVSNEPFEDKKLRETNCGRFYFYQDILLGLFDTTVKPGFKEKYLSYIPMLEQAMEESPKFAYIYKNMRDLLAFLAKKVDLGVRLRAAYQAKNSAELEVIKEDITKSISLLETFKKSFKERWDKENRPFGYEVMDGRMGFLKARLETARELLGKYLKGRIDKIDQLEEKLLPYSTKIKDDELFIWKWDLNVSPSEL